MRFLVDTNCWMQLIRKREHADEVRDFLREVPASVVFVSDFSAHTLIILMRRHNMLDDVSTFVTSSGFGTSVALVDVPPILFDRVVGAIKTHGLDVDDAYQYAAAELHQLEIVSLDADFDRTPRGRLTPAQALERFRTEQQQQR